MRCMRLFLAARALFSFALNDVMVPRAQTFVAMSKDAAEASLASYEILIRSVGQGIREVHGNTTWESVQARAESLWHLYAVTTGLDWAQVVERVHSAWLAAAEPDGGQP